MLSSSLLSLAALSLASLSTAAVAIERSEREVKSVEFQGNTIYYYPDAIQFNTELAPQPLLKRTDQCGASTFEPAPPRMYS